MTPEHRRRAWRLWTAVQRRELAVNWYALLLFTWREQRRTWRQN